MSATIYQGGFAADTIQAGNVMTITSSGAYIWDYDSMEQLVGWLAAQRDAGNCEIKSWSRWYADLTGRWFGDNIDAPCEIGKPAYQVSSGQIVEVE